MDFYEALNELIEQIPDNRISTPLHIAEALGDRRAVRAVSEAIPHTVETREVARRLRVGDYIISRYR